MNAKQVRTLDKLMGEAAPLRRPFDDPEFERPVLQVSLEVAHGADDGNTYRAKFWTVEVGYRCPGYFYLRSDGKVYVWDDEVGEPFELLSVAWKLDKHIFELVTTRKEGVLS